MNNLFNKNNFFKLIPIFILSLVLTLWIYNFNNFIFAASLLLTVFFDDNNEYALLTDMQQEDIIKSYSYSYNFPEIPNIFKADNGKPITEEYINKEGGLEENHKEEFKQQDTRHENVRPLYLHYESDKKDLFKYNN